MMRRFLKKPAFLALLLLINPACWAGDVFWLDVRSAEEFDQGHVSTALNIPYEEVPARIFEVTDDKDAVLYLYCRSGRRAGIAKQALEEMGFAQVINLETLENAQSKAAELSTQ
jgi:phage shock protein E